MDGNDDIRAMWPGMAMFMFMLLPAMVDWIICGPSFTVLFDSSSSFVGWWLMQGSVDGRLVLGCPPNYFCSVKIL
jgi:hypothetical protein